MEDKKYMFGRAGHFSAKESLQHSTSLALNAIRQENETKSRAEKSPDNKSLSNTHGSLECLK
jgi:hypothetical protein